MVWIAGGLIFHLPPAHAQACPRDALSASQAVWPAGSIRTGQTVTATHPCGRRLSCTGGVRVETRSRHCRWL
jgi:hypothetical protein